MEEKEGIRFAEHKGIRYLCLADLDTWFEGQIEKLEKNPTKGDAATLRSVRECLIIIAGKISEKLDKG